MKLGIKLILALAFISFVQEVHSQTRCNQISDPVQKRKCLERENAARAREAQRAGRRLDRLNLVMHRTCQTYQVLDQAARLAAAQGQVVQIRVAGATYATIRGLLSAVTREQQKCESARRDVENARRP